MIAEMVFDGIRTYVSSKGISYGDIFVRGLKNGQADMEQLKFRTFDQAVINAALKFQRDDIVVLDLIIKEAVVSGVGIKDQDFTL